MKLVNMLITRLKYPSGKGADQCVECGECEEKCPPNLKIIDGVKPAHAELYRG